jgi:hypothetical protein
LATRLNAHDKFVGHSKKSHHKQHGAKMADSNKPSHKKKKRKHHEPVPSLPTPAPARSKNAVVTEGRSKKASKLVGVTGSSVCQNAKIAAMMN